jgi:hypothetical protein
MDGCAAWRALLPVVTGATPGSSTQAEGLKQLGRT